MNYRDHNNVNSTECFGTQAVRDSVMLCNINGLECRFTSYCCLLIRVGTNRRFVAGRFKYTGFQYILLMCRTRRRGLRSAHSSENLEVRDNLRDLGVDGRRIFRLSLER